MRYLVDSEQMRICDRNTSTYYKVPPVVLMERAAIAVAQRIGEAAKSILVVCGTGNNGADGLAVARIMKQSGKKVQVLLLGNPEHRSELNRLQLEICRAYDVYFDDNISENEYDMVVDALYGIGFHGEIPEDAARVLTAINKMSCPKLAVDMPSGVNADNGQVSDSAVMADITVTFGFEKIGMYRYPGKVYCGKIVTEQIGITEESFLKQFPDTACVEQSDAAKWWTRRRADGNKGTFGKVLLMAGCKNMAGACILAAKSCYRSGAGMVKVLSDAGNRGLLMQHVPEALFQPLNGTGQDISDAVMWADVIVAGPGIGTDELSLATLQQLVEAAKGKVLVLDADALNLLSRNEMLQQLVYKREPGMTVLTPHMGELARLTGKSVELLKSEGIREISNYARDTKCTVIAKDAVTMILSPGGKILLCDCGNDGMATAGTGDVLAGMTGAILAAAGSKTAMNVLKASAAAVYLHGMAGTSAAGDKTKESLMAGDLIEYLPRVIKEVRKE